MITDTEKYFLELVDAAIHGTIVPAKPEDVSFIDVYNLAQKHSLEALTYLALERLEEKPGEKLFAYWTQKFYKAVITDTEQLEEYKSVCELLKECGAQIIPIKGIVIKNYYHETAMRSMSDVDILYRHGRRKQIHKKMLSEGYEVKSRSTANYHDTYIKDERISIELHRSLLSKSERLQGYFEQVFKRAKANGDGTYKMTPEDEYLYFIAHSAKHFFESGLGVRPVIDCYLYKKAYADNLDMKYVRKILGRAKLTDFEKRLSALGDKWFAGINSLYVNEEIEEFFLACEPHGSSANLKINLTQKMLNEGITIPGAKRKYVLHLFFPPYKEMCEEYTSLKKTPVLLPVFWARKLFDSIFFGKVSVKKTFIDANKNIGELDEDKVRLARKVYGYFLK